MLVPLMLIIIGFLPVGVLAFTFIFKVYKSTKKKNIISTLIPTFDNCSPRETSKRMMREVSTGQFLMSTLINTASQFNDRAVLAKYKNFIRNPSVISYIQDVKGGHRYE